MVQNTKKVVIKFFNELYNREPTEEELKSFIECIRAKEEKGKEL